MWRPAKHGLDQRCHVLGSQPRLLSEHMRLGDLLDGGHDENGSDALEKRRFGRLFTTKVYDCSTDPGPD